LNELLQPVFNLVEGWLFISVALLDGANPLEHLRQRHEPDRILTAMILALDYIKTGGQITDCRLAALHTSRGIHKHVINILKDFCAGLLEDSITAEFFTNLSRIEKRCQSPTELDVLLVPFQALRAQCPKNPG